MSVVESDQVRVVESRVPRVLLDEGLRWRVVLKLRREAIYTFTEGIYLVR